MAEIVETELDEALAEHVSVPAADAVVAWVVGHVNPWRDHRDSEYSRRWEEYYRLWRGIWAAEDKTRNSERSRIITPALQQAVEGVTSEIESAILDKPHFFDMVDDAEDNENQDIMVMRSRLREDLKEADFETAMNQIFLMGSIFGTGLGKLVIGEREHTALVRDEATGTARMEVTTSDQIRLVPILPTQFVIDPAAKNIKEALGCAHEYVTPLHEVHALQQDGTYRPGDINMTQPEDALESDEDPSNQSESVNICEYHGYVPLHLLRALNDFELDVDEELVELFDDAEEEMENQQLVEAIITIGNGGTLLKAVENPTLLKERMFYGYRHEIVPDQFWGRGVCEKGYNSQKALDASMRARIDGLALTVHPMMGIDGSKMPKGFRFNVSPGKSIITTGDPSEVLRPMNFGNIDPNVFTNTAELERMVSMSTGGFDTAAPVTVNNRNETASGMSMQLGTFVKRSKRTIRNIENEFIIPMVSAVTRIYMEIWPERYPAVDVSFKAVSVLGTMARELEQAQFASMLNTVPPQSPAFWMLVKSIYELSTLSNREEMVQLIDGQLQQALNPPPPPPDPLVELKRMEITGRIRAEAARIRVEWVRAQSEIARAANDARLAPSEEAKNESQAILNLAKAEAEELGSQLNIYKAQLESLERDTVAQTGVAENVIETTTSAGTGVTLNDVLDGRLDTPS